MNKVIQAIVISIFLMTTSAFAADLAGAKQQGWVGEQGNGYLGLVKNGAPADVAALVANVNGQRKAQFAQIAAKNGIAVEEAAKVFAREAAERTLPGNYVQTPAGAWVRK